MLQLPVHFTTGRHSTLENLVSMSQNRGKFLFFLKGLPNMPRIRFLASILSFIPANFPVLRRCLLLFSVVALSACKLTIEVPVNGSVQSASGTYSCASGQTCTLEISDTDFNDVFMAVPASGYAFTGWVKRDKGLCGGKYLDCALTTADFENFPLLMTILASNDEFFLEPEFKRIGKNKVTRGPVAGATVKAFTFDDLEKPVEERRSLKARQDLDAAGTFSLSLDDIPDDELVVVVASGGEDLDIDGDGVLDKKPTPNFGSLFAVARASDWRAGGNKVNLLTDIAYLLAGTKDPSKVLERVGKIAAVTAKDVDGSGDRDYRDLLGYDPVALGNVSQFSDTTVDALTRQGRKGQRIPDRTTLYRKAFDILAAADVVDQASTVVGDAEQVAQVTEDGDSKSVSVTALGADTVIDTTISKPSDQSARGKSALYAKGKQLQIEFTPSKKGLASLGANQALNRDSLKLSAKLVAKGVEVTIPKDLISSVAADKPTFNFDGLPYDPIIIQDDPVIGWYFPFVAIPEEPTPDEVVAAEELFGEPDYVGTYVGSHAPISWSFGVNISPDPDTPIFCSYQINDETGELTISLNETSGTWNLIRAASDIFHAPDNDQQCPVFEGGTLSYSTSFDIEQLYEDDVLVGARFSGTYNNPENNGFTTVSGSVDGASLSATLQVNYNGIASGSYTAKLTLSKQ